MGDDKNTKIDIKVGAGGVEAKVRSRWLDAFDRLRGNKTEIKGLEDVRMLQTAQHQIERAAFEHERHMTIERAKLAQQVKALEAAGDLMIEKLKNDPAHLETFRDRFFPEAGHSDADGALDKPDEKKAGDLTVDMLKIELRAASLSQYSVGLSQVDANVDGSLHKAAEQMALLQMPKSDEVEGTSDRVDEDWLNFWKAYAEKASSESMRLLWGRILAGEVLRDGTFSRTTLRIAAELSKETATIFNKYARTRYFDSLIPSADYEADLGPFMDLEDAGLIGGVAATITRTMELVEGVRGEFMFPSGDWCLVGTLKNPEVRSISVPVLPLSRSGRELASIIGQDDEVTLRNVAEHVTEWFSKIELFRTHQGKLIRPGEILKQEAAPNASTD